MDSLTDHSSLIAALGGAAEIASSPEIDTIPVTARACTLRNKIPPEYWPCFIALAARKGIAVDAEWFMRTTPARKRSEPEAPAAEQAA